MRTRSDVIRVGKWTHWIDTSESIRIKLGWKILVVWTGRQRLSFECRTPEEASALACEITESVNAARQRARGGAPCV